MQQPSFPTDSQLIMVLALTVFFGALFLAFQRIYTVLLLIFLGIVLAIFLDAVARGIARLTHLRRGWSVAISLLLLLAIAGLSAAWTVPRIAEDVVQLSERLPQSLATLEHTLRDREWGRTLLDKLSTVEDRFSLAETARRFLGVFSTVVGGITGAVIIFVLGIYFAFEPRTYTQGTLSLIPPARRAHSSEVLRELGYALRWWLLGRMLSMLVVFGLTWIGLTLLGVPLAFLLAAIAGLLSFIPNIGPLLSLVPAVLVPLGQSWHQAVYVVFLYAGVQALESYLITPMIQRKTVSLPPALLLVFQLLMGILAGFLGLFVATPLLVVIMVLVKMLYIQDQFGERASLP